MFDDPVEPLVVVLRDVGGLVIVAAFQDPVTCRALDAVAINPAVILILVRLIQRPHHNINGGLRVLDCNDWFYFRAKVTLNL